MTTWRLTLSRLRSASVFSRLPTAALICAVALLMGVALAWARAPSPTGHHIRQPAPAATNGNATRHQPDGQIREGTEIVDQLGYFRMTGDRVTFFTDDGEGRFVGLENLNLERVARTIADNPQRLQWAVTGTIAEYRGANFLFVHRAVLKSRVQSSEGSF